MLDSERRLGIPEDISVVGYDDEEVARHLSPQLTTLLLPHREMGRWAVERGFALASGRRESYPITKLDCPLIPRSSISAPVVLGLATVSISVAVSPKSRW